MAFPTGDLDLAFCHDCGFITNTAFDPSHSDYTTNYEETQGFSATFSAFADRIARDLLDRHDLHGGNIVEIGCGKGEFLLNLCRIGGCSGVGYDPVFKSDRVNTDGVNVQFIPEFFTADTDLRDADCIVCRHTLEHIRPTLDFMRMLRKSIGDRDNVTLFFELPDVARQLTEGAFWDLFYEHCSYFSAGSLARLFRRAGFEVLDLERTYRDQYLLITAKPASDAATASQHYLEDDLDRLRADVERFEESTSPVIEHWRKFLAQCAQAGRRVVLWGSGSKSVGFLTTLGNPPAIEHIVDINPHRAGRFQPGLPQQIVRPQFLREYKPDCVLAMNPMYLNEIRADLEKMGLHPELLAV